MSKKISWSQFEIKDAKPNLVSGWNDLELLGSGINYIKNWNFEDDDMSMWNDMEKTENNTVTPTYGWVCRQYLSLPKGTYMVRAKYRGLNNALTGCRLSYGPSGKFMNVYFPASRNWVVSEREVEIKDDVDNQALYILTTGASETVRVEVDWVQITPIDNQHIILDKENVGGNLTRIRTWGGKHTVKLMRSYGIDESPYTLSLYVETNKDLHLVTNNCDPWSRYLNKGFKGFVTYTFRKKPDKYFQFQFRTYEEDKGLDFIASTPQIVRGLVGNPTLVVKELDDGREHVKVYGATPDTKLIYDELGFKGDLYSFATTIENEGTYMNMKSTIGDYNEEIKDGVTEIKHEGNLRTPRIEIELGASDE